MNKQPKILVKHSRIEISNYDLGDVPKLEYIFSVWDPITHNSYPKAIEYDKENRKLLLPRGIDIPWLEHQFGETAVVDRECDEFINMEQVPIKYLSKDDRQLNLLKFLLGEDKYYYTKSKSQLSCNSTTGSGKTFITVAYMCFTGSRIIIITSNIDWLNQWKDRILEYTPLTEKDIYMITGMGSIDKILCRDPLSYRVFLASHSTIKSYGDKNGWSAVDQLFKYLKCSTKVFDEAHVFFDNVCRIDYHSNCKKTIYLTATPERSNEAENEIFQLYFKTVPSISLYQESDSHVNYIAMHFNSHPTPKQIMDCKNAYGFNRIAYTDYVVHTQNFKHLLNVLVDLVYFKRGKALMYIGTNYAITIVYNYLITQFPFLDGSIGIYTSAVDSSIKQQQLLKPIILSTTKSCGAASDIQDLMITINLAEPFKSPVLARQTLGRCRANDSLYIDIVDQGFYSTKKYYSAKKKIFSMYAKSCKDVVLSDSELESRSLDIVNKYTNKQVVCKRVFKE